MIISRTPLRISFFGGGTDYPEYFRRNRGAVIGMTINKYIYISALKLVDFVEYKYRVSYSKLERVGSIDEIEHPVVRNVLRHFGVADALDISVHSDLPARSGLGSSSAFTVGLINLVGALLSRPMTKLDLARQAILVERDLLKENVGVQDQLHAAFGGINRFDLAATRIRISPVQMRADCIDHLTRSLALVHSGVSRFASETLSEQIENTKNERLDDELAALLSLTDKAVDVLEQDDPDAVVKDLGAMMQEGWLIKRRLSSKVSLPEIDGLYERAMTCGALGGKLCGAGGGGFMLFVVPAERMRAFITAMAPMKVFAVGIDTVGSMILHG